MGDTCAGTWVTHLILHFYVAQVDFTESVMGKVQLIEAVRLCHRACRNSVPVQGLGDAETAAIKLYLPVPANGLHQIAVVVDDLWQLLGIGQPARPIPGNRRGHTNTLMRTLMVVDRAPPVKLALARSSLRELEAQNLERLSGFTSRRAALERSVQAAKLSVNGAKLARAASLEKQWVRSPMAGLVSDIRVKSVTLKGITLEVILCCAPFAVETTSPT